MTGRTIGRRGLLAGGAAALPAAAFAKPCEEEERRRLLKFGDLIAPEAYACGGNSNGPGPGASSPFLTVDFTSAFNYPGGSGQQVVSQRMYGVSGGGIANNGWSIFGNSTFRTLAAQINPGLFYFKNSSGTPYWNANGTVNTGTFTTLINNFGSVDLLGISGVIFGADWHGTNSAPGADGNPSTFGTRMGALATYLNGKLPVVGFMGQDEPNSSFNPDTTTWEPYYNAMATAVKAVNSSFLVVGPNTDSMIASVATAFTSSAVPQLDVLSWDTFAGNGNAADPNDSNWINMTAAWDGSYRYLGDARGASASIGRAPTAFFIGGYNIGDGTEACDNSGMGAVFQAYSLIQSLNGASQPFWACMWDGYGDGAYGVITDPAYQGSIYGVTGVQQITPRGYFMSKGVRNLFGPRWTVTQNGSGMTVLATTPALNRFAVCAVNTAGTTKSGTVALSHWPVNGSGAGTANVWQMPLSAVPGVDGTATTVAVSSGVTAALSFPSFSTTIVYM